MSKIHLEILDKERQKTLQLLSHFKQYGYLGGGTALSLQIAHRESFDFDVFVNKPIGAMLKKKVREIFGDVAYYVNSSEQISFQTKENIHITFLWYYFDSIFPYVPTEFLSLAAIKDIAADKAHTIGRRAVWRDYVDFFFLLKQRWVTLQEIISLAKKKFKGEFNEVLFLQQLSYFKDVEVVPITYINESFSEKQIEAFLEGQVEHYIKNLL